MLELLEWRHDWMSFPMTVELMRYVLTKLIPDVIFHSAGQDEEQVTDHYDRGDDFHEWCVPPSRSCSDPLARASPNDSLALPRCAGSSARA